MVDTSTVEEAPTSAMEAEVAPARRKVSSHLEQILSQMNILKAERAEQEKAAERARLDFEGEKKKAVHLSAHCPWCGRGNARPDTVHTGNAGLVCRLAEHTVHDRPLTQEKNADAVPLISGRAGDEHPKELLEEVAQGRAAATALSRWYATMAEGAKAMVWDAEKMDVIVTACQADLFKLKMDGNQTKTRMNQMRMFGKAKVYGMQLWMDYVKREKYLRLKEALDQANRRLKDLGQELVNYETVAESHARKYQEQTNEKLLAVHMRRVMNSLLYRGFRQWHLCLRATQAEATAAREQQMKAEANEHFAVMKKQQTEAKLKVFWNRMRNRKEMAAWRQWTSLARKGRNKAIDEQIADAVEESGKAMKAKMDGEIQLKLRLYLKTREPTRTTFHALLNEARDVRNRRADEQAKMRRVAGFMKQRANALRLNTLIALKANKSDSKTIRLRETDAIKKLRQKLEGKLKGVLFATFGALQREYFESRSQKMADASAIEGNQIHQRALESMADLFLLAKEDRRVSAAWGKWCREVAKTKVNALYAKTKREERAKYQVEQSMLKLTATLEQEKAASVQLRQQGRGHAARGGELEAQLQEQEDEIQHLQSQNAKLQAKMQEVRDDARDALDQRDKSQAEIARLRAKCQALEAEMDTIVDEIGFVREVGEGAVP